MNTTGNARFLATEEVIENAALNLLKRKRYDDFSIKDLCIEAGINRSSFYAHYQDINDLMIKIEAKFTQKIQVIWQLSTVGSFIECFTAFFEFVKENVDFYKSFIKSAQPSFSMPSMLNMSRKILVDISNQKSLNYADDEIDYHLQFFAGGLKSITLFWIQNDCNKTPKEMAEILHKEYAIFNRF